MIHIFNLIIPISYGTWLPDKTSVLILLGIVTFSAICTDLARTRVQWLKSLFVRYFDSMLRSHELSGKFTGATWVLIGAWFTILIFPKPIAIMALVFMSVGDTTAGIIGMQFGNIKIGSKTLEGSLSGLMICILTGWLFPIVPITVGIVGSVSAMVVELLPLTIDDNVSIPITSGTIMILASNFLI
jgi:glycerol-3-phosphate acyltransferase PlsY